ncbi:MAG: penicillin acylase family protein [Verrucomicrobia bacterium]|nr:penicillin acylase family protein [Verrucomicrobiota bacterium]
MSPVAARRLRLAALGCGVLCVLILIASGWVYARIRASLPQLAGSARVAGLGAPVTVERDALGAPTIRGTSRADVARALGWLHAQDRFFQMDLLRRSAAGELAELFGRKALPRDRATRMHGFRALSRKLLAQLPATERTVVEAYAAGVNAGLGTLGAPPFEYLLLRTDPQPWRAEDCVLVSYAMALDLQDASGRYERTLMTLRDTYGAESLGFFAPLLTPADAALDGSTAPQAAIPGPGVINLRATKVGWTAPASRGLAAARAAAPEAEFPFAPRDPEAVPGSNALALAGALTASGAGLLANDMHLGHAVPNIWYRAMFEHEGRRIVGATLPGAPFVVAGSNGQIAWGFTNACVDVSDLVVVETNSIAPTLYKAPGHADFLQIETRTEILQVKGEKPETVEYQWTLWGPLIGTNDRKRPLALRWTAHDPASMNLRLLDLESARTTGDAIAVAHRSGITPVNLVVADRAGEVAWTLAGQLPRRVGYDGRLPVSWSYGDRKWDGYLGSSEVPVVRGADSKLPGRIWSANQRQIGGDALGRLGDSAYAQAARGAQIRDGLATLTQATPRDLLAIQLDNRALFLAPWHRLLLETLSPTVTAAQEARARLRRLAETWEGRASVEAVSYRIVREFRQAVRVRVFSAIFAPCLETMPDFDWRRLNLEPALWALVRERPSHLLAPEHANWEALLTAAVDDTIAAIEKSKLPLPQGTWGERNRARIRHPFSGAFPFLARWLDLPADPLPGDSDMPRVQTPTHGASERLVVSPGHEAEGIYHMPGGQSGHPLSPYYRAGHAAWVRGEPSPLLPGAAMHHLTLDP